LPYIRQARRVILVDAVSADAPVGTLVRVTGDEVGPAAAHRLSPHQVGVADLLDGARLLGGYPESITIVGVVPGAIELSVERTPDVEARIDDLVRATVLEAASLGHVFTPKEGHANDSGSAGRDGLVGL
jgi:hydrogenase maturation protease